jgi:hypothetical protein
MKLEHGKKYVTQGGWIVEIMLVKDGGSEYYFATQKTSPGVSLIHGKTAAEYAKSNFSAWAHHCGWQYITSAERIYQQVQGIDPKDFAIVGEYPCEIDPPHGYSWAAGFPKVEKPVHDRIYLTSDGRACRHVETRESIGNTCWVDLPTIRNRRILLEKIIPDVAGDQYYVPTPKYTWDTQNKYFVKRGGRWYAWSPREENEVPEERDEYWRNLIQNGTIVPCSKEEAMARVTVTSPKPTSETYYLPQDLITHSKYFVERDEKWFYYDTNCGKEIRSNYPNSHWANELLTGGIRRCSKSEAMVAATPPIFEPPVIHTIERDPLSVVQKLQVPKEEQMKSSTFVSFAKSAASRTLGAGNYLYVEPAKIIGGYVKRSLRYVVFFGTLTGIVYGVNDPASLKKKVASCMPKITIEAPAALK